MSIKPIVHGAKLQTCPKEKEMRNRHIVDQLADVRAQIKELKQREGDLKDQISAAMGKSDSLGGDQFMALQKVSTRKGAIDTAKLQKAGIDVDAYRKADTTVYQIVVEPRVMEAA